MQSLQVCKLLGQHRLDRVLVYAPEKEVAFEVDPPTWEFLNSINGRDLAELKLNTEEDNIINYLQSVNLLTSNNTDKSDIPFVFAPSTLILLPTSDCNLRCAYCFSSGGHKKIKLTKESSFAAIDFIINKIIQNNKTKFHLGILGGGEPTLEYDLVQTVIAYAKEKCQQHSIKYTNNITSNGVFNKIVADWIISEFKSITISFDGPEDVMRLHRVGAANSYHLIVDNIK